MTGTITTCITDTAKMDFFQAGFLIAVSNVQTGNTFATTNNYISSLTNTAPLVVGMTVSGPNLNTATTGTTTIAQIINSTAIAITPIPASAGVTQSYTFSGDTFNV